MTKKALLVCSYEYILLIGGPKIENRKIIYRFMITEFKIFEKIEWYSGGEFTKEDEPIENNIEPIGSINWKKFVVGDIVKHHIFGAGIITRVFLDRLNILFGINEKQIRPVVVNPPMEKIGNFDDDNRI